MLWQFLGDLHSQIKEHVCSCLYSATKKPAIVILLQNHVKTTIHNEKFKSTVFVLISHWPHWSTMDLPVPVASSFLTSEPVASSIVGLALSGAHEMHSTTCSCSLSSALHSFVATTHTRTVWSLEQLAIREPSWLGRTMRTHSLWPVNVFTQYLQGRRKSFSYRHKRQWGERNKQFYSSKLKQYLSYASWREMYSLIAAELKKQMHDLFILNSYSY